MKRSNVAYYQLWSFRIFQWKWVSFLRIYNLIPIAQSYSYKEYLKRTWVFYSSLQVCVQKIDKTKSSKESNK